MTIIKTNNGNINIADLKCVYTHGGGFHADDVCTVALLEILKGEELEVHRIFKAPDDMDPDYSIIFDIGGGEFDHHSDDRECYEDDKCPMAAFGKVARAIKIDGCSIEDLYPGFTAQISKPIEARDNGFVSDSIKASYFAEIVNPLCPLWDKDENSDTQFRSAVNMVKPILQRQLESLLSKKKAQTVIEAAPIVGRVIVLDKFAPWQDYINDDIIGAIFPSLRGGWNVQIAGAPGPQFNRRADFADSLKDSGLVDKPDGFIHPSGHLCGTKTKDRALQIVDYIIPRADYVIE